MLDERRMQLSDLRRHLEKESTKNGMVQAEVEKRTTRNQRGDARLRELEDAFDQVLRDERLIESRAAALEADLAVFASEHRELQENVAVAAARLDRAEGALQERERAVAETRRESDRLDACVRDWRRTVAERDAVLRSEQEKASRSAELAREAGEEASSLEAEVDELRRELAREEAEGGRAAAALGALKERAAEVGTLRVCGWPVAGACVPGSCVTTRDVVVVQQLSKGVRALKRGRERRKAPKRCRREKNSGRRLFACNHRSR